MDGTIPSTTQDQRTNSSALIDASDISTSDMGSMSSSGGGGGFGGMPANMPSDVNDIMSSFSGTEGFTMPDGLSQMPDQGSFNPFSSSDGMPSGMPDGMSGFSGRNGFSMPGGSSQMPDQGSFNPFSGGGGISSGMPDGMSGFSGGNGFSMPGGSSQMPGQGGSNPFGTGNMGTAQTAEPAQEAAATEAPATDGNQQTESQQETDAKEPMKERSGRPEGFSAGGAFPGTSQGQRTQWIWLAVCSAVLLAAILIIRRFGNHNN